MIFSRFELSKQPFFGLGASCFCLSEEVGIINSSFNSNFFAIFNANSFLDKQVEPDAL